MTVPAASVAGGGSATFTVTFTPTAEGLRSCVLHISSNDADENPYDITLTGTAGADTISELAAFGDRITYVRGKVGFNAFSNTTLEDVLSSAGIENVLVCGMVTSLCIDSTGRAAYERGYDVTILSDCTSARTTTEHEFFCDNVFPLYGRAVSSIEVLEELARRDQPVALIVSDHRMPEMTGIELLERSRPITPGAKRVLLTAYADTEVAIKAINDIGLDHYLMKPWAPPEERLYPVLDDQLEDWRREHGNRFQGVRVVGSKWSERSHDTRMFLARNHVPYQWLELGRDAEARWVQTWQEQLQIPVVTAGLAVVPL